ncbi:MAG: rRNA maturation RNase YbeY [Patescibacteria group bacterium]|jgi:probable rRNA maturation factor
MSKVSLDLVISGRRPSSLSAWLIKETIKKTLKSLKINSAVLGLAFLPESKMAEKNKTYRRKKGPTDVLSFAYPKPRGVKILNGDILICPSYATHQAKQEGMAVKEELERLLIHGLLHLAGYDHVVPVQAKRMLGLQEKILRSI